MKNTRAEAKAAGDMLYFTGKPCRHGHVAPRYTSIGKCKACTLVDAKRHYREARPDKAIRLRRKWDTAQIIAAFRDVHGDRYDYCLVEYEAMKRRVGVRCTRHGVFPITPENHLAGKGCPACANAQTSARCRKTQEVFITQAAAEWGEQYDFSDTRYETAKTPITVRCRKHGPFATIPDRLLNGGMNGCPQCGIHRSQDEEWIKQFLSRFAAVEHRDRTRIAPFELDVVVPEHRLAVEYCGMYYHSVLDERYEYRKTRHRLKYDACRKQGLRLVTIYEWEWKTRRQAVLRLLRRAVGADRGKVYARQCTIGPVADPRAFFDRYHVQGGAGHGVHYGLYFRGKLVACMRFTFGANDRGRGASSACWTLTRYATRVLVVSGASRLFAAFLREHRPDKVKSYSDNRYFEGGLYAQLGFSLETELPPDYAVWHPRLGLKSKQAYQRRLIPTRLRELGMDAAFDPENDPRTEADMQQHMGAARIYDCGKKRWVWSRETAIR